jgi:hypothetical protein
MSVPSNLVPTRILQLPEDPAPSDLGYMMYVNNGVTYKVQVSAVLNVSGVPTTRTVIAGTGLTGGGALSSNITISVAPGGIGGTELNTTGVAAGVYGDSANYPVITVDANGRVTAATELALPSTSGFVPTSRQVIAGAGLSGGGALTSNVTLAANLSNDAPLSVGTTSSGVSTDISRSDHIHPAINLADTTQTVNALDITRGGTGTALTAPANGGVVYSDGSQLQVSSAGSVGQILTSTGAGAPAWTSVSGTGTVTSVSVVSANGLAGTVANATTTPGITLSTTITGLLRGNGTAISAATIGTGLSFSAGTLTNTAPDQVVSLTAGSNVTITGTYPSFTIASAGGGGTTTFPLTIGTGLSGVSFDGSSAVTVAIDSTVATLTGTQNLTNKTLDNTNTATLKSSLFTLQDASDINKQATFVLSSFPASTAYAYTLPNLTGTLATLGNLAQTFAGAMTFTNSLTASNFLNFTGNVSGGVFATNATTGTIILGGASGTGAITLGRSTLSQITNIQAGATASGSTKEVNLGTGGLSGSTTNITIGSTNGTTATANGAWTFSAGLTVSGGQTATFGGSVNMGTVGGNILGASQTTGLLTLGGPSQTGTITLGQSTVSQTTNIQAGATASGSTKTLNIGTGGLAGSTTNTTIGATAGTSSITLNGNVGLGIAGQSPYNFIISKNITGGTASWGFVSQGIIQSDVTFQAILNGTGAFTQATTFTLSNLYHYNAAQGTFGAGSTVTNQYGFFGSSSLIGATNNYGFYGAIAAGTGRWNFYANGTAQNYFAGELGIGILPSTSTQLVVAAGTTAKSPLRITQGVAPTSPVDGDMWTTAAGLFIRINGVTKTVTLT